MRASNFFFPCLLGIFYLALWPGESAGISSGAKNPSESALSTIYAGGTQMPAGAITVHPHGTRKEAFFLDDYDDTVDMESITDPLEPWNRFWFKFNNIFYLYVAKPTYQGYSAVTPHQIRDGMKNFFSNLLFPVRFVNNILQFRFMEAGVEFGRFLINTTTSFGFANVARDKKTIVQVDPSGEDFGQTLGRWGMGHGFYIVWPFIGPSSPRDTLGRIGDLFPDPFFHVSPWEFAAISAGYLRFNDVRDVLSIYEDMNNAAVDPYIAMRQAYINFRRVQVNR